MEGRKLREYYFEEDGMRWNVRLVEGDGKEYRRDDRVATIGIIDGCMDIISYAHFTTSPIVERYIREKFTEYLREEIGFLKISKEWIEMNVDFFKLTNGFIETDRMGHYNIPDADYETLLNEKRKDAIEKGQVEERFQILLNGKWIDAVPHCAKNY